MNQKGCPKRLIWLPGSAMFSSLRRTVPGRPTWERPEGFPSVGRTGWWFPNGYARKH
ncbi:MAG: hypothetical protein HY787_13760 [Deltaproteobacteria bacterium]|nr:hypothetical protein [Deltaproteobacteria bacterium]